jgi:glyoxylase-like metal-dependent hydrolase (beta-lactamase superfamily II)
MCKLRGMGIAMENSAVERINHRVWRIALPLPMRDLKEVNAYAIGGDDGVTLIDPGWANAESESILLAGLAEAGWSADEVRRILVTHAHWDHYTQAVKWRAERDVTVYLGRGERHTIEAFDAIDGTYPNQVQWLRRAGAAGLAAEVQALELEPWEEGMPLGEPDVWLDGGEQIDCGGVTVIARATPGHTRGHMVFEEPESELLFTGDHILPRITPSIGFERAPQRLALSSYLESLHVCERWAGSTMLPAHGAVVDDVGSRVGELLAHHRQRLDEITDLVRDGARTAYEVARQMRWTRKGLHIDELGTIHGMTAVLEVLAHLELLAAQDVVYREDHAQASLYEVA